ncbi:hypothetical protein C1H46_007991 [Malus baccata]|uniref:Uncharacterized protein n=1 Tax=Malus baccata TaxID=106549 RepID=A0A540N5M2_MALBA|nr:hypothetical protein C1H46_007991 [Malus baccata]
MPFLARNISMATERWRAPWKCNKTTKPLEISSILPLRNYEAQQPLSEKTVNLVPIRRKF